MDIVLKLRELRRFRGMSQKDAARLSGVGEKTISSFETGERIGSLKLSQLGRLLVLYGVTEEEFFSRKMDVLFDPNAVEEQSRAQQLLKGLDALPREMRDALLERFELMLNAAQLAAASNAPQHTPPAPPLAGPATRTRAFASAALRDDARTPSDCSLVRRSSASIISRPARKHADGTVSSLDAPRDSTFLYRQTP